MLQPVRTLKFNICPSSNRLNMSSDILEEAFYQNIAVKWCSRLSELLNRMVNVTTQLAEPRQEAALQPLVQPSHIQSVVSPVKTERRSSGDCGNMSTPSLSDLFLLGECWPAASTGDRKLCLKYSQSVEVCYKYKYEARHVDWGAGRDSRWQRLHGWKVCCCCHWHWSRFDPTSLLSALTPSHRPSYTWGKTTGERTEAKLWARYWVEKDQ